MKIKELNKKFGDRFGYKYGRPRFAWINSTELKFPVPASQKLVQRGSLYVYETKSELVRCVDGPPRWVLAVLVDPPSEAEWAASFGSLDYPGRGYYAPTDQMCRIGASPNEELTDYMIGMIVAAKDSTREQTRDAINDIAASKERESKRLVSDQVDDAIPAFGNIPGTKEHVSFPGVS